MYKSYSTIENADIDPKEVQKLDTSQLMGSKTVNTCNLNTTYGSYGSVYGEVKDTEFVNLVNLKNYIDILEKKLLNSNSKETLSELEELKIQYLNMNKKYSQSNLPQT